MAKKSFDAALIEKRISEGKIKVRKSINTKAIKQLMDDFNIGEGEAETMEICLENNWKLVGTDDKNAIKACIILEIMYSTAMGILVVLNEKGILPKDYAMVKLDKLALFGRYSDDIIEEVKNTLR